MRNASRLFMRIAAIFIVAFFSFPLAAQNSAEDIKFSIERSRGTVYTVLGKVSSATGLMFIYDSQIIDNEKSIKLPAGEYSLTEVIRKISGNENLKIRVTGKHALIYAPQLEKEIEIIPSADTLSKEKFFAIEGTLIDRISEEPVVFGSVNIPGLPIGIVTNQEGAFRLILPDSLQNSTIRFSHIGYESREVTASLITSGSVTIFMEQKIIPLQEVIVRAVDPVSTIKEMLRKKVQNYPADPSYITAFYREGVEYKNNLCLSEAVMKIYKTGVLASSNSEQVKLLKMRRMTNIDQEDTLVARIRSSVNASLLLDVVKNPTDFLTPESMNQYNFTHSDITEIDGRRVYVFSFEQNELVLEPLFKGELYVDADNLALLKAKFEIHPDHIRKSAENLIVKRSRSHSVTPIQVVYEVSYRNTGGMYFINHVRGDLTFRVKKSGRLFASELHAWFEMVNCKVETENVRKFPSDERFATRDIFSQTSFEYDPHFWRSFNVILPERELRDLVNSYNFSGR
ncbi:MAG: hypothetical protein CVT93_02390 [Bacteroidetes bacterium HGW-Bacteroidetes-10]|nr:MAG: hypothetical protein CVT93_02390 [Bacteroidetes bacterium HGW-Bacteroidetes-10]